MLADASSLAPRDRRPLATQVREAILRLIAEEDLRPGDRMPTEEELVAHFQVGRSSVREALRQLEELGVVDVQRGLGRFVAVGSVAPHVERPITRFESVTEMIRGRGYEITNRVLEIKERPASLEEAASLDLKATAQVIELIRLRKANEKPAIYSKNIIPGSILAEGIDAIDWTGSVTETLAAHGQPVVSSVARISAELLPAEARPHFAAFADRPWLLISEVCTAATGLAVLLAADYHRGDIFSFDVVRRRD